MVSGNGRPTVSGRKKHINPAKVDSAPKTTDGIGVHIVAFVIRITKKTKSIDLMQFMRPTAAFRMSGSTVVTKAIA
jgi:hypothetical protein